MSTRVKVGIEEQTLTNDSGRQIEGVVATCGQCGHQTESFGTGPNSRRRCLALLREECPEEQNNFYVDEDAED